MDETVYKVLISLGIIAAILLIFVALAIVCDDYLCLSLERICDSLKVPDDVAGASFLALGSAAPEIAINAMACLDMSSGQIKMSVPAIFGSAMVAFALIPAACVAAMPGRWLRLQTWPLFRDTLSYVVCLLANYYVLASGTINWQKSLVLVLLFVVYLTIVYLPTCCGRFNGNSAISPEALKEPLMDSRYGSIQGDGAPAQEDEDDDDEEEELTGFMYVFDLCIWQPIGLGFKYTIPLCEKDSKWDAWYPVTFLISIAYVAALSGAVLVLTQKLSDEIGLSQAIAGATLLALGAQVPDTFASVGMAKQDMADGAVSNAVGSQVINITIGTGLPFLLYNLITHQDIIEDVSKMLVLSFFLFGVIAAYVITIAAAVVYQMTAKLLPVEVTSSFTKLDGCKGSIKHPGGALQPDQTYEVTFDDPMHGKQLFSGRNLETLGSAGLHSYSAYFLLLVWVAANVGFIYDDVQINAVPSMPTFAPTLFGY